jgi:hypothetical protein
MAHRPTIVGSKRRLSSWRLATALVLAISALAIGLAITGCAWWQEAPQQPRTVTDWMKLPRVEP